jgi:hypothetical protein
MLAAELAISGLSLESNTIRDNSELKEAQGREKITEAWMLAFGDGGASAGGSGGGGGGGGSGDT